MVNKYHNKEYVKSGGKPKGSVRQKVKIKKRKIAGLDPLRLDREGNVVPINYYDTEVLSNQVITEKNNRMLGGIYPTESFPANQRKRIKRARNGNKN